MIKVALIDLLWSVKTGNSEIWHSLDVDNKKVSYHQESHKEEPRYIKMSWENWVLTYGTGIFRWQRQLLLQDQ